MHELELQTNRVQSPPSTQWHTHQPKLVIVIVYWQDLEVLAYLHSNVDHIDKYMEKFQKLAKSYQLPRDKWNFRLSQDLSGAAYEVYSRLPPGHENNFECLKVVLLKWYKLISHMYRQKVQVCPEGSK